MNGSNQTRRTVLKTLGAGVVGGALATGPSAAHGGEERTPAWLLTDVWEMADREPSGEDPTNHHSHVPIYYIAPGAGDKDCAQVTKDFSDWEDRNTFATGEWSSVPVDQTLHDRAGTEDPPTTEFSTLWHAHFVFGDNASPPYKPGELVNEDSSGDPLINSGERIQTDDSLQVVSVPYVFNCPARPAQGDHRTYCDSQSQ